MTAKKIVPIVEGPGDVSAVPVLLRRLLFEIKARYEFEISRPKNANGRENLTKPSGLERFLQYAAIEKCSAAIVILDTDSDCAKELAFDLAERTVSLNYPFPVAIVCATREYEAWFLASLETIAGHSDLPPNLRYEQPVETKRDVKGWLTNQMPPGRAYKETQDQVSLTNLIDFDLAYQRSRSFQRLIHAIDQLIEAVDEEKKNIVTPLATR
jgi:hypothetical protein